MKNILAFGDSLTWGFVAGQEICPDDIHDAGPDDLAQERSNNANNQAAQAGRRQAANTSRET